jgi:hypothetical protein
MSWLPPDVFRALKQQASGNPEHLKCMAGGAQGIMEMVSMLGFCVVSPSGKWQQSDIFSDIICLEMETEKSSLDVFFSVFHMDLAHRSLYRTFSCGVLKVCMEEFVDGETLLGNPDCP